MLKVSGVSIQNNIIKKNSRNSYIYCPSRVLMLGNAMLRTLQWTKPTMNRPLYPCRPTC